MIVTQHIWLDPAYRERLRACGLDSVSRVLQLVEGHVAAWSRSTDTLHVPDPAGRPGFYVKRYFFHDWTKRLRGTFRGTFFGRHRAQAEWRALNALRAAGVPAARPVAWGERRVLHFLTACFLITEEVPQAQNLTSFALDVRAGRRSLSQTERNKLLCALAEQLAAMHEAGCAHGNLFWRNLLVRYGPDDRPEYFFLDAQPLRAWERFTPGGTWLRELAQVCASALPFTSRSERLRFVRHYLGVRRCTPSIKSQLRYVNQLARGWQPHEDRRIRMTQQFDDWHRQLVREQGARLPSEVGEPLL